MFVWGLQAAGVATGQEMQPPASVGPSAASAATVRKASPPTAARIAAAETPKPAAPAARAQSAAQAHQSFNLGELMKVTRLPPNALW